MSFSSHKKAKGSCEINELSKYRGQRGRKGEEGDQGCRGPRGHRGQCGKTGAEGPAGFAGVQGPVGSKGKFGPLGFSGAQGPQGPRGVIGVQGVQGPLATSFWPFSSNDVSNLRPGNGQRLLQSYGYGKTADARVLDPSAPTYDRLFIDVSVCVPREVTITGLSISIYNRVTLPVVPDIGGGQLWRVYIAPPDSDIFDFSGVQLFFPPGPDEIIRFGSTPAQVTVPAFYSIALVLVSAADIPVRDYVKVLGMSGSILFR